MSNDHTTRAVFRILLPLALAALLGCGGGGVNCSITFEEPKLLKKGDPVLQNGIPMGKVTAIKPNPKGGVVVHMRLDRDNIDASRVGSLGLIGIAGDRQSVELHPIYDDSPQISEGSVLEGVESAIALKARKVGAVLAPAWGWLSEKTRLVVNNVSNYINSPEGKKLAADTKQFLADAQKKISQNVQDFRAAHPEFEEKLKEQLKQAKDQSNEALVKILEEIQKSLQDKEK